MNIVIDTGVVVSAFFLGGLPRRIIKAVVRGNLEAYATREIVGEYEAVIAEVGMKKGGSLRENLVLPFTSHLHIVKPEPDEDKFIACTLTAGAFYVVEGGADLSAIGQGRRVKIITVEGICQFLDLCAL